MRSRIAAAAAFAGALAAAAPSAPLSPVAANGQLRVQGTQLVNARGEAVQLRGFATHGLQWFHRFYASGEALAAAGTEWGADVIRITLYLTEDGYLTSKTLSKERFEAMIDQHVATCEAKGMYVVIDWHVHKPGIPAYHLEEAKVFFAKMAAKYAHLPNVMWEICNEPSSAGLPGVVEGRYVEWSEIAEYARIIIPIIRAHNPEAIVLVGTPSWSSLGISSRGGNAWQEIADKPLAFPNVLYVIHYYANAHTFLADYERASQRLPLFATEWAAAGYQETSQNDEAKGKAFVDMLNRRKISWAYWSYSNNPGVFATFSGDTTGAGPFGPKAANVTQSGRLIHKWMNEPADSWAGYDGPPLASAPRAPGRAERRLAVERVGGRLTLRVSAGAPGSAWTVDFAGRSLSLSRPEAHPLRLIP